MIEAIMQAVTEVYNVTPTQIKSKSRKAPLPEARRMIVHFVKENRYDDIDATNAIKRDRTYVYKASKQIKYEIILYSDIAVKATKIHLKLEELTLKK